MAYREGQRLKGSDGNIYVVQNGQPVLAPQSLGAGDPTLPSKVTKAQNEATASNYAPKNAQADALKAMYDAKIAEANAAVAAAKNSTDLKIAQANLQKTQAEIANLNSGKGHAIDALQQQLDRVGALYREKIKGGLPNPIWGHVPTATNEQFTTAAQGIVNPFQAAFRVPGVGSQSDTELRQFIEANTPTPHDTDLQIEEKMRNLQTRIDAEKGAQPAVAPDQAPDLGLATGKSRAQIDPALQGVAAKVGMMLANGTPGAKIEQFMKSNGVDPASTDLAAKLKYRISPEFKRWQRANPGAPYPIDPSFYTKQVPMTGARQFFNKTAATDVGGSAMAGVVAAGDALAGGRGAQMIGQISGDPGMAQTGMEMLRTDHPTASVAGDIAGQALFEAGLGRIPGAQALMATKWGRRGADALYGAYSGSGANPDDPLSGALTGAATNAGFGMAGRSAQRGVGRMLTGVKNPALQYLDNRGVPLTIGQIGRGSNNIVGRTIGGLEERAMGLPGFDAVIGKARQRGDEGFNRAAFKELGASGASTGAQGVVEGSGLVDNAYNFLNGAQIPLDAQFAGSQAGVRAAIPTIPAFGPEIGKSLDVIDKAAKGGSLSGRDWQSALRAAKANSASIQGQPFSQDAGSLLGDVQDNLVDLAGRQGPQGAVAKLQAANQLYSKFRTITKALDNGPAQMGELFSPKRLDTAALSNARGFGGQTAAVSGNRPFYDLTTAGKEVMPNLTPDSGTAGRMALMYALSTGGGAGLGALAGGDDRAGGAEMGAGYGAALGTLAGGVYSKPAQQIIQKTLLGDRNPAIQRIGNYLINQAKMAGIISSALGRDYVYQPELPQ
jgi:hypothetical protein